MRVDYLDQYNSLDPIFQESVRIREGVHVERLTAVTVEGCPWGCFAMYRAMSNGINALGLPAFRAQVDFLNDTLDAVPRSEWTIDHQRADLFRQEQARNLSKAEQYLREGRK